MSDDHDFDDLRPDLLGDDVAGPEALPAPEEQPWDPPLDDQDDLPGGPEPQYDGHDEPYRAPELQPEADAGQPVLIGVDPDARPDDDAAEAGVFPPAVDVGDLPEPVDGFPWIDTAVLGAPGAAGEPVTGPVDPAGLAAYAAVDLPAGADPWAALAASEDPATSALARFWAEDAGDPPGPGAR